ncbi:hypothetical protein EH243_13025 [Amphritea opalescens]|uniref:Uncharacterized protein n=1 Tax=Amphritea opalescens TaxID=2490544 RepID=A0A430KPS9_9GAMM|nr:hypothetical protein [Amphritea opalescens]RTE65353.1 hypothetical protein EH243_13025 [Amphritea opalescens]
MTLPFDKIMFKSALVVTAQWDFGLAIQKLLESNPEQWNRLRAEKAVLDYQRYMAVTKALGGIQLVPNADIDEIWHMHILDTRAYMKDCEALFGEFLHHYPYFGMLSEENQQEWLSVQAQSEQLWLSLFDQPLYSGDSVAQKCPQACPCHIEQLSLRGSSVIASEISKSA